MEIILTIGLIFGGLYSLAYLMDYLKIKRDISKRGDKY